MKKIVSILLVCMLMMSCLSGCGNASAEGNQSNNSVSIQDREDTSDLLDPENPIHITFYSYSLGYPSMKPGMEHLIQAFNDGIGKEISGLSGI